MDRVYGEHEIASVLQAAQAGARLDGRAFDEIMPVEMTTGVINQASGSVELRMGDIHLLAGVKVLSQSAPGALDLPVVLAQEQWLLHAGGCRESIGAVSE